MHGRTSRHIMAIAFVTLAVNQGVLRAKWCIINNFLKLNPVLYIEHFNFVKEI